MRVTEFTDYRQVVHAWMAGLPHVRTQGLLKRRTGRATSTISMILQGKRPLQPDDADNWGRAMRLEGDDLEHFVDLVRLAHGAEQERKEAWERVIARQAFAKRSRLPLDHDVFGRSSTWALLALVDCAGFDPDPAWIARTIVPPMEPADVEVALTQLLAAGLLRRAQDGRLSRSPNPVATEDGDDEAHRDRWSALHVEQLEYALSALEGPVEERHVVGVVAAVPEDQLEEVAARLEGAIREALVFEDGQEMDRVVQISLQIVPRSRKTS